MAHPSTSSTGGTQRSKTLALLVAILIVFVGYTVWREARKSTPAPAAQQEIGHPMGHVERPPMSAEEERFAQALWKVHDVVRTSAVKMTFAGMSYKVGDSDKAGMRDKVVPLIDVFKNAHAEVSALTPPQTLQPLRADYLEALKLYMQASRTMTQSTKAGDDQHLLVAHGMSEKASSLLLKVGDALWPGEYKPN